MTPACHNRPEFIAYEHPSGEVIQHAMSQPCKSWSTGDRATPVRALGLAMRRVPMAAARGHSQVRADNAGYSAGV